MTHSLSEGAAFFTAIGLAFDKASKAAVTRSARIVRDEAKRVLGTYDYGWTPLAPATIERKQTGDSPLLETGKLKRSIKYSVHRVGAHWEAFVGSNDPKALWHELGTSRIPPRPFLSGAAKRMEKRVHVECGHNLFKSIFHHHHPDFEDEWSYDGED